MVQWFVLRNEEVAGPFTTDEVKTLAAQGEFEDQALIWGRLQNEWKSLRWWMVELPNLLNRTREVKDDRQWHFAVSGTAFGPFSRSDLIFKLKDVELNPDVLVWTKGMKAWAPIFEFHDLLDEIGINKRQFPRADIEGKAIIKSGSQNIEGQLVTISEGGFGADNLINVSVGQVISVEIQSDSFYDSIHAKAEVRYITDSGYAGFRFLNINMEARGAIIQYVKNAGRNYTKAA